MKLLKWIFGGCFATAGLLWLLLCIAIAAVEKFEDPSERVNILAAGFVMGLPPSLLGGVLLWSAYQQGQREYHDRLWNAFYELIQTDGGHISALSYAMKAKVTGEVARQFLDARSREFNGHFRVSAEGDISYWFSPQLGQGKPSYQLDQVLDPLPLDTLPLESSPESTYPEQEL
ncbi:MAG: hypothetical protein ACTS2F_01985 [Thainema sp.]